MEWTTSSSASLLEGSIFGNAFNGGLFTHAFLGVNNHYRFHTPVAGKVLEQKV